MMLIYLDKEAGLYIKELLLKNSPETDVDVVDIIYQIDNGLENYVSLEKAARRTCEEDS